MKVTVRMALKPCPWCKKTPEPRMPIQSETWKWDIMCINEACKMNPVSRHVNIRNTRKVDPKGIAEKLDELVKMWNTGNDYTAYEYKVVDLTQFYQQR